MSLVDDIMDRQKLRRKLGFWRIASLVATALCNIALVAIASWGDERLTGKARDHIAHVVIAGAIGTSDEMLERLEAIEETEAVRGLIVTISSPGGTTTGGEALYETLRRIAEDRPVVAQVETMAASAGYMIASATDHIIARQTSIVGSIGVIFQYPKLDGLLDTLGVDMRAIKSTPLKAEPNFFGDTPPEAEAMIRAMILDSFEWFKDIVAERRGFDAATITRLADGSVFTGRQAIDNGLVDQLGGFGEAEAWLRARDGIGNDLPVIEWREPADNFGLLLAASGLQRVAQALGLPLPVSLMPEGLRDRVFLDGLLSVWHLGADFEGTSR